MKFTLCFAMLLLLLAIACNDNDNNTLDPSVDQVQPTDSVSVPSINPWVDVDGGDHIVDED